MCHPVRFHLPSRFLAAACGESPQAPAPSPGGPASVSVVASIEAAGEPASQQQGEGGLGAAFEAADVAAVRVAGSGGAELSLELTIEDDRMPVTVELALRQGSDELFEDATGVTLVADAPGTAEAIAAHEELSASVTVEVAPEVATDAVETTCTTSAPAASFSPAFGRVEDVSANGPPVEYGEGGG